VIRSVWRAHPRWPTSGTKQSNLGGISAAGRKRVRRLPRWEDLLTLWLTDDSMIAAFGVLAPITGTGWQLDGLLGACDPTRRTEIIRHRTQREFLP
jgi:hypothetical protein